MFWKRDSADNVVKTFDHLWYWLSQVVLEKRHKIVVVVVAAAAALCDVPCHGRVSHVSSPRVGWK